MYHKEFSVDGSLVSLDQIISGAGARFRVEPDRNAAPGIVDPLFQRARAWCESLMQAVPRSTARAWHAGRGIELEAMGDNAAIESRVPLLERELTGAAST